MAVDEHLADRVRGELDARAVPFTEKRMFGSLAFIVEGEIAVCVRGSGDLLVRHSPEESEELRARHGGRQARMGQRPMGEGWLDVDAASVESMDALAAWVDVALRRRG